MDYRAKAREIFSVFVIDRTNPYGRFPSAQCIIAGLIHPEDFSLFH
jgi:hypothetical protein